jgi:hypothetical protein
MTGPSLRPSVAGLGGVIRLSIDGCTETSMLSLAASLKTNRRKKKK